MTKQNIEKIRRNLGELAAMQSQVLQMEKKILSHAQAMLAKVQKELVSSEVKAKAGGETEQEAYQELIQERGRLNIVISKAQKALS